MRLFLYGTTAAQWWARAREFNPASGFARCEALVQRDCAPSRRAVEYIGRTFPFLTPPYHFLVASDADKRALPLAKVHVSRYPHGERSFVRVADGVYAASPELCFVQSARHASLVSAVWEGCLLCGSFALDEQSPTGLVGRTPLTSVRAIRRFVRENPRLPGVARCREALRWTMDKAASPREAALAMRLALPIRLGGYGLGGAQLNCRIDLGRRSMRLTSSSYFIGDLCWPDHKLVVEYDSDLHLTSSQLAHDAEKRGALEASGYKVVTVTRLQLDSPSEMFRIASRVAGHLGKRLRIQVPDFARRQALLFNATSSRRAPAPAPVPAPALAPAPAFAPAPVPR